MRSPVGKRTNAHRLGKLIGGKTPEPSPKSKAVISMPCPTCKAEAGLKCVRTSRNLKLSYEQPDYHVHRIQAARDKYPNFDMLATTRVYKNVKGTAETIIRSKVDRALNNGEHKATAAPIIKKSVPLDDYPLAKAFDWNEYGDNGGKIVLETPRDTGLKHFK